MGACNSGLSWIFWDVWSPCVEVSLGKILNPRLLPMVVPLVCVCVFEFLMSRLALCREATYPQCVSVCVKGWMLTCVVKALWVVERLEKRYINTVHLPFTIFVFVYQQPWWDEDTVGTPQNRKKETLCWRFALFICFSVSCVYFCLLESHFNCLNVLSIAVITAEA